MRIAILSAGPSLRQTFKTEVAKTYDARIAVNSAAALFACDHWVCGDGQTFARTVAIEEGDPSTRNPILYTIDAEDGHFRARTQTLRRLANYRVKTWPALRDAFGEQGLQPPGCWMDWSITAAVALAVYLGATRIDVFGHDMTGVVDANGFELIKRQDNWRRVASAWIEMFSWATDRFVDVYRVPPGGDVYLKAGTSPGVSA